MATPPLPIKKQVSLHWESQTITLDVAQDLFSSHQVDRGSKMLLATLEGHEWPDRGDAADFGCGYGVLGLAWQQAHPEWTMCYVDRDALAVVFAEHNVASAGEGLAKRAQFLHAVSPPMPPEDGFDLVLWNVPGKAGQEVVQALAAIALDGLAPGGMLALVVVHPLAAAMRDAATRSDVVCELDEIGKDHTVLHLRRIGEDISGRDAFDAGVFDRPPEAFALGDVQWTLTPVGGLPEYDSLSHATMLAGEQMVARGQEQPPLRWLAWEPGVGHLPVLAHRLWPHAIGVIAGRDALALRSTQRALGGATPIVVAEIRGAWSLPASLDGMGAVDLAMVRLSDQAQVAELEAELVALEYHLAPGGHGVFYGGSSEVGRIERLLARRGDWRPGKRKKHRGASAMMATRV